MPNSTRSKSVDSPDTLAGPTHIERLKLAFVVHIAQLIVDADETLDYGELKQMMSLIKRLNDDGHTIIMITHCIWIAAQYAHRTVLMSEGEIIADGPTRKVFSREDTLARANIIAPQIVRFSEKLGATILSVDEFLQCAGARINLDESPAKADSANADWLKTMRKQRGRDDAK